MRFPFRRRNPIAPRAPRAPRLPSPPVPLYVPPPERLDCLRAVDHAMIAHEKAGFAYAASLPPHPHDKLPRSAHRNARWDAFDAMLAALKLCTVAERHAQRQPPEHEYRILASAAMLIVADAGRVWPPDLRGPVFNQALVAAAKPEAAE